MKKIFYCLVLFTFFCTSFATAEEIMPSWEGVYCSATTDTCLKIEGQNIRKVGEEEQYDYAFITFFTKTGNALIITTDLDLYSPTKALAVLAELKLSQDRKTIKIIEPSDSEEKDTLKKYHYDAIFGEYIKESTN